MSFKCNKDAFTSTSRMLKDLERERALLFIVLGIMLLVIGMRSHTPLSESIRSPIQDLRYVNVTLAAYLFSDREINEPFDVYFPIPCDAENQKVISFSFNRDPDEILRDEWNQSVARFRISSLKAGEISQIIMSCTVKLVSLKYDVERGKAGSLDDISEEIRSLYTRDEEMYKIHDPIIISSVREAVKGEKNIYEMVMRIHDYVIEKLSYKLDARWDDAPTTLSKGEGSCSEYVFVFIALCRAAGIPARFVGGTAIDPSLSGTSLRAELVDYTFHRWAEVYIPNYGWLPVDITYDDGPYTRDFLFSLTDTFFAFVKRGGNSKYLGWSYLPVLDSETRDVELRVMATWVPILEAQKALLLIHKTEEILFHLDKVANSSNIEEIRYLINESLKELDKGEFTRGLSFSQQALSMAMELKEDLKGSRTHLLSLFLISISISLAVSLFALKFRQR